MTTLKPYPAYKDSGVAWLGDVPSRWRVQRAKTLLSESNERAGIDNLELLSLSKSRGIIPQRALTDRLASASDFSQYRRVRPGQLVMNRMQAWNGLFGSSLIEGMISPDYAVFDVKTDEAVLGYLLRLVRDPTWVQQFAALSTGIGTGFNRLYSEDLGRVPFLVPPLDEQRAIAGFLDGMDARITRFIAARRKMIALLEEQKQAVINQAVTRGLDPDVPTKDSGVDWLGEIPAHWELKRLKQVCSAIVDCKNRTPELVDGGEFTVVRTTNIRSGKFDLNGSYSTDERNYQIWTQRGAPQTGDVFFTREAPAGEACLVPDIPNLCMGQRMMYFRSDPVLLDSTFLLHSLYGPVAKTFVDNATNGSTVGHLRLGQVSSIPLLWCSVEEQRSIAMHIDRETSRIDTLISHNKREIQLMLEYRVRLISDVVTGKLDVRGVELPPVEAIIGEEITAAMEERVIEMEESLS